MAVGAAAAVLALTLALIPQGIGEVRAAPGSGSQRVNPSGIVVDDPGTPTCPHIDFTSIQAAVTASPPGSVIQVCPGEYNEQVVISKRLTLRGVYNGNENQPIVKPALNAPNTTSLSTGNPIAAVILVTGTDKVTIESLTVDGSGGTGAGCVATSVGIYYRNASGAIQTDAVRNITNGVGLTGCQGGLGIFVQSGGGGKSKVEIEDNAVHDYDKNGITATEPGTDVTIRDNTVTGRGATNIPGDAAQNGIQISFGAKGKIQGNSVIDHVYTPCVSVEDCTYSATAILIYGDATDPANDIDVKDNEVGSSQTGIYVYGGNRNDIVGNRVSHTLVWDGIALVGNRNKAEDNDIQDSDESGVWVEGDYNKVEDNFINEALCGVVDAGGTGNNVTHNQLFNTTEKVCSADTALSLAAPTISAPRASAFR